MAWTAELQMAVDNAAFASGRSRRLEERCEKLERLVADLWTRLIKLEAEVEVNA